MASLPTPSLYLGKTARDKVTGFTGTITAYSVYLHGRDLVLIEAKSENKNQIGQTEWFIADRVDIAQPDAAIHAADE